MGNIFQDIRSVLAKYSGDFTGTSAKSYSVDYSLLNSHVHPSTEQMPTASYPVNVTADLIDNITNEHIVLDIPLLNVPHNTNMGAKINSTYYGVCSENSMAPGWYHLSKDGIDFITQLHVISGRQISFVGKNGVISAKIGAKGEELPLGVYLKAMSGLTYDELQTKIGLRNPIIAKSFVNELDYDTCVDIVLQKLLPSNDTRRFNYSDVPADVKALQVKERLGNRFITLGNSVKFRYELTTSFTARCKDLKLAKPIKQMPNLAKGTLLTTDILEEIDKIEDLTTIFVEKHGRTFETKRYPIGDAFLSLNEVATQLNIMINNMCGFGYLTGKFDTINREVVPFEDQILRIIDERMSDLHINISTNLASNQFKLRDLSEEKLGNYDLDKYINDIKGKLPYAQLSETNNIWAQSNKESKIVIDFNGPATSVMVSIKDFQYGVIDLYQIPESTKIGSVDYMSVSTITEDNVMKAPHYKVVDGVVVKDEIVYLSAHDMMDKNIAFSDSDLSLEYNTVFYNNGTSYVQSVDVDYIQCSIFNTISIAHAAIPFAQFIDGKRIVMGCSQFKQAQDCLASEAPLVSTGALSYLKDISKGVNRARDIVASIYDTHMDELGQVPREEFIELPVKLSGVSTSSQNYRSYRFEVEFEGQVYATTVTQPFGHKSSDNGMVHFYIAKSKTFMYQGSDIVLYRNSIVQTDPNNVVKHINLGQFSPEDVELDFDSAVGVNLTVAYTTGGKQNVDDSIILSGGLLGTGKMANLRLYEYRKKKINKQGVTETFGYSKETDTHTIDGMPKKDTYIPPKGCVFWKKKVEIKNGKSEINYIRCNLEMDREGYVLYAYESGDEAICCIASIAEIEVGDKVAGDHGNKGVIGKIVHRKDMPFMDDGTPVDILLNPLGVPSRMNFAQFVVALLGRKMKLENSRMVISPYNPDSYSIIKSAMLDENLQPIRLYDGKTCRPFDRDTFVGDIYMKKQTHNVKSKYNAVGKATKYNMMTNSPNKGKSINGGQSMGEMESWALMANDAPNLMYELYTVKAGDNRGMNKLMDSLESNEDPALLSLKPENNNIDDFNMIYTMLGTKVYVSGQLEDGKGVKYSYRPLTDKDITSLAEKAVDPSKENLQSEYLFGMIHNRPSIDKTRHTWQYMDLKHEIVHPIHLYKGDLFSTLYVRILKKKDNPKSLSGFDIVKTISTLGKEQAKDLIKGMLYVGIQKGIKDSLVHVCRDASLFDSSEYTVITGIEALVYLLKNSTLDKSLEIVLRSINKTRGNEKMKPHIKETKLFNLNKSLSILKNLVEQSFEYSDLVITKFPIIPRSYRVSIETRSANFDYYYGKIRSAVKLDSANAPTEIYKEILRFIGLDTSEKLPSTTQAKNFLEFLVGKNSRNNHGLIREQLVSKVINYSGRSSIIPGDIPLGYVGIPRSMCYTLYEVPIKTAIKNAFSVFESESLVENIYLTEFFNAMQSKSRTRAIKAIKDAYGDGIVSQEECVEMIHRTDDMMKKILAKSAVVYGRQPTLRPESVRGGIPVLVEGYAIQIHINLCTAFNADFDGDQMWVAVAHSKEAKREALTNMHPSRGIYSPKDGSVNFKSSQDVLLGIYLATMLHENVMDYRTLPQYYSPEKVSFFSDIEMVKYYVATREIDIKDLICYTHYDGNKYLSTAGRVIFNSFLPKGFTGKPFTNPLNIGFINPEFYCELQYDGLIKDSVDSLKDLRPGFKKSNYYPVVENSDPKIDEHWINYRVFSIKDILKDNARLFTVDSVCEGFFEEILNFGIRTVVVSGITLCLQDFKDDNSGKIFEERYNNLYKGWLQSYKDGLLSKEDFDQLLISAGQYCTNQVQKQLMSQYDRNDNVYVIVDSGARGSVGQVMKSTGMIGIVSKSNTEQIPSPIFNGFRYGLTLAESFILSYGTRLGVSTTQLDTAKVGAMTRDLVYATGMVVTKTDCGCGYKPIPVDYEKPFASNANITGRVIKPGTELFLQISKLSPSGEVTADVINYIHKNRITNIDLVDGTVIFKYHLSPLFSNMMLNKLIRDENVGGTTGTTNPTVFITKSMMAEVEEKQLNSIKARTVITCNDDKGVCAACYGVRHEDHLLPNKDYAVGIIAATSIGEPSTQLVLNMINQGGSANSSAGALEICNSLISGSQKTDRFPSASLAQRNYYVTVVDEGHNVLIKQAGTEFDIRVPKADCLVVDGEYVYPGTKLTSGIVYVTDLPMENDWMYERSYQQVKSLYSLYHGSNLSVDARHFEVIVRTQLNYIEVCDSKVEGIIPGRVYNYNKIKDLIDSGKIMFRHRPLSKTERVFQLNGTSSSLMYADMAKSVANTAINPAYNIRTDSPLEQLINGANIITNTTVDIPLKVYDKSSESLDLDKDVKDILNSSIVEIIPDIVEEEPSVVEDTPDVPGFSFSFFTDDLDKEDEAPEPVSTSSNLLGNSFVFNIPSGNDVDVTEESEEDFFDDFEPEVANERPAVLSASNVFQRKQDEILANIDHTISDEDLDNVIDESEFTEDDFEVDIEEEVNYDTLFDEELTEDDIIIDLEDDLTDEFGVDD